MQWRESAYCGAGAVPAGAPSAGAAAAGFSPVRRVWRRSCRPWRLSWRPVRLDWRRFIPWVPVASAGAAGGVAASCASASDGFNAADSVKPNAAPRPSRESAFRRDIPSTHPVSFLDFETSIAIAGSDERWLNDGEIAALSARKPAQWRLRGGFVKRRTIGQFRAGSDAPGGDHAGPGHCRSRGWGAKRAAIWRSDFAPAA